MPFLFYVCAFFLNIYLFSNGEKFNSVNVKEKTKKNVQQQQQKLKSQTEEGNQTHNSRNGWFFLSLHMSSDVDRFCCILDAMCLYNAFWRNFSLSTDPLTLHSMSICFVFRLFLKFKNRFIVFQSNIYD